MVSETRWLPSEAAVAKVHRQIQAHILKLHGNKWPPLLRRLDQNHRGAISQHGLFKACREVLHLSEDAVPNSSLNLLHTVLDRGGGTVDLDELIVFFQSSCEQAYAAIAKSRRRPPQSRPKVWGQRHWRDQQQISGGPAPLSLPARRLRGLMQDPEAVAAASLVSAQLTKRCGSLASARLAMDIFRDGRFSLVELVGCVQSLGLLAIESEVRRIFAALNVDGDERIYIDDFMSALEQQRPTVLYGPRSNGALGRKEFKVPGKCSGKHGTAWK